MIVVDGATHSHKDDVESNGGCLENAVDGATHSHKDGVESNGGCLENAVDGATHSHKDGVEGNGQFTITCHLDCLLKVVIK